jgi:predicted acyl esterase
MNLTSHLLERVLKLDPPLTRELVVEHDLRVPMADGTVLLADRWAPWTGGDGWPVLLMRSPYACPPRSRRWSRCSRSRR